MPDHALDRVLSSSSLPESVSFSSPLLEVITKCLPMASEKPIDRTGFSSKLGDTESATTVAIITSAGHRKGRLSSFSEFHLLRRKLQRPVRQRQQQQQQQGGLLSPEVGTKESSHGSESASGPSIPCFSFCASSCLLLFVLSRVVLNIVIAAAVPASELLARSQVALFSAANDLPSIRAYYSDRDISESARDQIETRTGSAFSV